MTRFYAGVDPMRWLEMPLPIVQACIREMGRLEAQESLLERDRISVGMGSLKPSQSRDIQNRWLRNLQRDESKRPASAAELATMGIQYSRVKKT